jgi:hypothetical protein
MKKVILYLVCCLITTISYSQKLQGLKIDRIKIYIGNNMHPLHSNLEINCNYVKANANTIIEMLRPSDVSNFVDAFDKISDTLADPKTEWTKETFLPWMVVDFIYYSGNAISFTFNGSGYYLDYTSDKIYKADKEVMRFIENYLNQVIWFKYKE